MTINTTTANAVLCLLRKRWHHIHCDLDFFGVELTAEDAEVACKDFKQPCRLAWPRTILIALKALTPTNSSPGYSDELHTQLMKVYFAGLAAET